MRSICLDYYIGSLLLWKGKQETFAALSCEPIYGYKGNGRPEYIAGLPFTMGFSTCSCFRERQTG